MKHLIVAVGALMLTGCLGFLGQPVNQAERFDNHETRIVTLETKHNITSMPPPEAGETKGKVLAGKVSCVFQWLMGIGIPLLAGGFRKN